MSTTGGGEGLERDGFVPVTVYAHVEPDSELRFEMFPGRERAVLHIEGTNSVDVALFGGVAEFTRLRDVLGAVLVELSASRGPVGVADGLGVRGGV